MLTFHAPTHYYSTPHYHAYDRCSPFGRHQGLLENFSSPLDDFFDRSMFEPDPILHRLASAAASRRRERDRQILVREADERARTFARALQGCFDHEATVPQKKRQASASSTTYRSTYSSGGDGKGTYRTTTKRVRDAAGNVKTYAEDSMNGRVLRKRQQHLLPGSKSAEVLTRYAHGTDADAFEEAWKDAPIRQRDPFLQGAPLIEGSSLDEVTDKGHEGGGCQGQPDRVPVDGGRVEDASGDRDVDDADDRSMDPTSDASVSSLTSLANTMPDDWMVPVQDVGEGEGSKGSKLER